jgi:sugar-specific transcriptional regulator TrmB
MAELKNVLEELGLNPKEAEIYLVLLGLGEAGATRISSVSGINRITTYGILNGLKEKGFVSNLTKEKKTLFVPINPENINLLLKKKQQGLMSVMDELKSLSKIKKGKPSVKLYEGKRAVYELMSEIFGCGKQVYSFGNMDWPEKLHEFDTRNLRKLRMLSGTKVRGITNHLGFEETKQKIWQKTSEARVLKELDKVTTWTYIFEGKVANISYKDQLIGELIEDSEFANTQMLLFEMLWKKAKVIR